MAVGFTKREIATKLTMPPAKEDALVPSPFERGLDPCQRLLSRGGLPVLDRLDGCCHLAEKMTAHDVQKIAGVFFKPRRHDVGFSDGAVAVLLQIAVEALQKQRSG